MTLNFFTSSSFNACLTTIGIIDNVLVQQSWICQGAEGAIGVSEQHLGLRGYLCFHKVDRHPETDKQYNRI